MTIGVEFGAKTIEIDSKLIKIQIWDTVNFNLLLFKSNIIIRLDKKHFKLLQEHIIKVQLELYLFMILQEEIHLLMLQSG